MEQREIKFRVWASNDTYPDGVMTYPYAEHANNFLLNLNGDLISSSKTGSSVVNYDLCFARVGWNDIRLMQYTGLKDKNGKEIYEGDIVQLTMGDGYRKCVVEFKNGGFVVEANGFFGTEEYDVSLIGWAIQEMDYVDILGNIYEHPSLLTEIKR